MPDWISGFINGLKEVTPALLLGIAIASAIALFIGDDFASTLGLTELRQLYRPYLGVALVLSLSLVFGKAIWAGFEWIIYMRHQAQMKKALRKLTPSEKAYLAPYIVELQNTLHFQIDDGIAGGLVAKKIIYRASTTGYLGQGWPHNLQPWAREYLEAHPECIN